MPEPDSFKSLVQEINEIKDLHMFALRLDSNNTVIGTWAGADRNGRIPEGCVRVTEDIHNKVRDEGLLFGSPSGARVSSRWKYSIVTETLKDLKYESRGKFDKAKFDKDSKVIIEEFKKMKGV